MIKGLSLWQPWASLVAAGIKRTETRGWRTAYRGLIAIHAASRALPSKMIIAGELGMHVAKSARADLKTGALDDLPRGCIVAVARLVSIEPTEGFTPEKDEALYGNYAPMRYAWVLNDIRRLDRPLPWSGHQWLWEMDDHDERRILAELVPRGAL